MANQNKAGWLLYGANGYTGKLICEIAAAKGLKPILAGRSASSIQSLAAQYGWEYRIFDLDSTPTIVSHLEDTHLVLHAAGPFCHTAPNMLAACLQTNTHYLDITGEIEVFAHAQQLHEAAKAANIMLMPGTGFDVVPTDCMAACLKEKLPDATHLGLAFVTLGGQVSHGTAMSMTEKLGTGGASRKNGKIVNEPIGHHSRTIQAGSKQFFVMSIPWGDVFTAFYTTQIPNITAFTGSRPWIYRLLKLQGLFNGILRTNWMKAWLRKKINSRPAGPDEEQRSKAKAYIWGSVTNAYSETKEAWFTCPEGYTLTAHSSVLIVEKVLANNWKAGYQTPAGCYGAQLVWELPNVSSILYLA